MSINWSGMINNITSVTTALTNSGVSSTSLGTVLQAIGLAANPNESEELVLCGQIIAASENPALAQALAMKLATEAGIPGSAAQLATTIGQPGVDIVTRTMQIEQLIKGGTP